ncbi:MAG: hypothetical protein JNG88_06000 [Phycisphaerales bacterium]|nr:hypothetical protein [Phycisphaerales bacterium]
MTLQRSIVAVCVLHVAAFAAAGPKPPREATSENERFTLRLELGRPGTARSCIATLSDKEQSDKRGQVWKRSLVNEVAPGRVLIRDDGRFVVTLDEFRRGGARNALVIYGERGELLRHFLLTDLLKREDWPRVRVRRGAVDWLSGARFAFDMPAEQFIITLRAERLIRIDLKTLRVIDGPTPADADDAALPADILAALSGKREARDAEAAEGEDSVDARLEKLIAAEGVSVDELTDERYRELLAQAEAGNAKETALTEKSSDPHADSASSSVGADRGPGDPAGRAALATAEDDKIRDMRQSIVSWLDTRLGFDEAPKLLVTLPDGRIAAGISGRSDVPVPQPDPANPVSYVEWYNNQTKTDGPSAAPAYQEAVNSFVAYDGDAALLDAAMKGDAAALASPEVTSWIESNRAALAKIEEGNKLEYRGTPSQSESGYLMGIILPNLAPMRQLTRVSVLDGKRAELDGRPQDAVDDYLTAIQAGAQVSHGVTLIEQLVGVAQQKVGADALLDMMSSANSDAMDYQALATRLEGEYRPLRPMASAIQGERAMMLDLVQTSFERDPETNDFRVRPQALQEFHALMQSNDDPLTVTMTAMSLATKGFNNTLDSVNRMYDRMTGAAAADFPRGSAEFQAISNEIETPQFRATEPLMAQLVPALNRANVVRTRADTQRAATMTVASILAHQQRTGALPDSLDALGEKSFLTDPFTGQRLIYRRDGSSFTLYSAGGNGADDGGAEGASESDGDLVYWPRKK